MNEYAPSLSKLQHEQSLRKPYAGNLHVRFDEEEGAACPPLLTLLFYILLPMRIGLTKHDEGRICLNENLPECKQRLLKTGGMPTFSWSR